MCVVGHGVGVGDARCGLLSRCSQDAPRTVGRRLAVPIEGTRADPKRRLHGQCDASIQIDMDNSSITSNTKEFLPPCSSAPLPNHYH
jgi:hypothetical protein